MQLSTGIAGVTLLLVSSKLVTGGNYGGGNYGEANYGGGHYEDKVLSTISFNYCLI